MSSFTKSAFSRHIRSADEHVDLNANEVHVVPYLTGGLKKLFKDIEGDEVTLPQDYGYHTSEEGHFTPVGECLMGMRYVVKEVLDSRGQSAVLVLAEDQFEGCVEAGRKLVVIKVLHTQHYNLGSQESHVLMRLRVADPLNHSHTLRLLRTLTFDSHYCMVFEPLRPDPLMVVFKSFPSHMKLDNLRTLGLRLLTSIGFLHQQNMIHTDLKPENILLKYEKDLDSVHIVDFGNTINYTHREMSMYYKDFVLQTPLYRAPEVMFGVLFGPEIDLWSLGCILAELYIGKPLFLGNTNEEIMIQVTDLLGPFPAHKYRAGKYFKKFKKYTSDDTSLNGTLEILAHLQDVTSIRCTDIQFADLLAGLLKYDPDERLTVSQAAMHPFFASHFPCAFLQPTTSGTGQYCSGVLPRFYSSSPEIAPSIRRQKPSSLDLLSMGTSRQVIGEEAVSVVLKPSPRLGQVTGGSLQGALTPRKSSKLDMLNSVSVRLVSTNTKHGVVGTRNQHHVKSERSGKNENTQGDKQNRQEKLASLMQAIQQEQLKVESEMDQDTEAIEVKNAFDNFCGNRKLLKDSKMHAHVNLEEGMSDLATEAPNFFKPSVRYERVSSRNERDHLESEINHRPLTAVKYEKLQETVDSNNSEEVVNIKKNKLRKYERTHKLDAERLINDKDSQTRRKTYSNRKISRKQPMNYKETGEEERTVSSAGYRDASRSNVAGRLPSMPDCTFTIPPVHQQKDNTHRGRAEKPKTSSTKNINDTENYNKRALLCSPKSKTVIYDDNNYPKKERIQKKHSRSSLISSESPTYLPSKNVDRCPDRLKTNRKASDTSAGISTRIFHSPDTTTDHSTEAQEYHYKRNNSSGAKQHAIQNDDFISSNKNNYLANASHRKHKPSSTSTSGSSRSSLTTQDVGTFSRVEASTPGSGQRVYKPNSKKRHASSSEDEYFDLLSPGIPTSQKRLKSYQNCCHADERKFKRDENETLSNEVVRDAMLVSCSQGDSENGYDLERERHLTSARNTVSDADQIWSDDGRRKRLPGDKSHGRTTGREATRQIHSSAYQGDQQQQQTVARTKQRMMSPPHQVQPSVRSGNDRRLLSPVSSQHSRHMGHSSGKKQALHKSSDTSTSKNSFESIEQAQDIAFSLVWNRQKKKKAQKSLMYPEECGGVSTELGADEAGDSEADDSDEETNCPAAYRHQRRGDNPGSSRLYRENTAAGTNTVSGKGNSRNRTQSSDILPDTTFDADYESPSH